MNDTRPWLIAVLVIAAVTGIGGYLLGRGHMSEPPTAVTVAATTAPAKAPLYYQDPDGKPDYSPVPKKTTNGRDFKPVYDDMAAGKSVSAAMPAPTQAESKGKIRYYRNPMGLPDTSLVPKKDAMGMDYVPVYENETGADANVVVVDPRRVQMLGVRTEKVQARSALGRTIRTTGSVAFDERRMAVVTTKVGGWVEQLHVAATGEAVRAGQPLLELYSPDLVAAEQEYLVVASMGHGSMVHGDSALLVDAALKRLRTLDVPAGEIARLQRSGKAARTIAVLAPANGVVTEKDAVLGMHVDPGTPLYKTADLSNVWLITQVQEQDIGALKPGQHATASFVAYPGRSFKGTVDFVYPTLSADTRTAKVRIVVPNPDRALRAEMYATVAIDAEPSSMATTLTIPDSAVIDSGARQVVLVVKGEGRFEPRSVRIGARGDGVVQITSGLSEGEDVVTSANFLIDAESNLRAALQSFAPPDDAKKGATP
jgi:Cu(I)/Ag(I) efflux system membrane fusion protein